MKRNRQRVSGIRPVRDPVERQEQSFLVMDKRCDQCLFSSAKIVPEKRKEQLIADCLNSGTHFVCHKPAMMQMKGEFEGNTNVCCRGFYDTYPGQLVIRVAEMLGLVRFVKLPEPVVEPQAEADTPTKE